MHEGRPHIVDLVMNREIHLIVNTPAGKQSQHDDSYIRKNAIKYKVPYITTLAGALAAARGIAARRQAGVAVVKSVQRYHGDIERGRFAAGGKVTSRAHRQHRARSALRGRPCELKSDAQV